MPDPEGTRRLAASLAADFAGYSPGAVNSMQRFCEWVYGSADPVKDSDTSFNHRLDPRSSLR